MLCLCVKLYNQGGSVMSFRTIWCLFCGCIVTASSTLSCQYVKRCLHS